METAINYISIGIGLVLAVIGIILQIKSNKKKEIVFSIKSNNLISSSSSQIENLTILYKDYKVENLTVSKVLFYNRGAETITQQDLMTINHFSIKSSDKILDARLVKENHHANNIKLYHKDDKVVEINFDYLDQNQGAIIQIIHNGLSSDDLRIEGSIMGMKNFTEIPAEELITPRPPNAFSKKILLQSIILGILGYYAIFVQKTYFDLLRNSDFMFFKFIGLIFVGLIMIAWWLPMIFVYDSIRRFLKSNKIIPTDLEQYTE